MDTLLVLKKPLKGRKAVLKYNRRGPTKFSPIVEPIPPDPGLKEDFASEAPKISFVKLYADLCAEKARWRCEEPHVPSNTPISSVSLVQCENLSSGDGVQYPSNEIKSNVELVLELDIK